MSRPVIVGLALREDDPAPIRLGLALAGLSGAPIVLVHALPREAPGRLPVPEYTAMMREAAQDKLRAAVDALPDGTAASTCVVDGSPSHGLQEAAEELGAVAVVVGSTHRGRLGRVLGGHVAAGLMHDTPCPVAVAPRGYEPSDIPRRIGVAYDGSPESDAALSAAVGIAQQTGGGVHAFTVLEPPHWAPLYATPGSVPSPAYELQRQETAQTTADHALESFPSGLQGVAELLNGPIVDALAGVSERLDLLVCGSRGYGPLHTVASGSVARGLALEAACPVLVTPRSQTVETRDLWAGHAAGHVG
jgi:nucleotide-binding universal stress UspA family protein